MEHLKYKNNIEILRRMESQRNINKLKESVCKLSELDLGIVFRKRNGLYEMMNAIVYDLRYLFDVIDHIPYENKVKDAKSFIGNAITVLNDIEYCIEYKPDPDNHAAAVLAYADMIRFETCYMCQDYAYRPNVYKMCTRILL